MPKDTRKEAKKHLSLAFEQLLSWLILRLIQSGYFTQLGTFLREKEYSTNSTNTSALYICDATGPVIVSAQGPHSLGLWKIVSNHRCHRLDKLKSCCFVSVARLEYASYTLDVFEINYKGIPLT